MAKYADMKEVVKHLVNGTFSENLCRICLLPFNTSSEDIFTTVCKNDKEYSIADVLDEVCNIKISPCDRYKICSECFATASSSYKFYLLTKRSDEILNFYINLLEEHLSFINTSDDIPSDSLCITLPLLNPETQIFDYDLTGVLTENDAAECMQTANDAKKITSSPPIEELVDINISEDNDDNDILIIADEKGQPTFYKALDGTLIPLDENSTSKLSEVLKSSLPNNKIKRKRRRNPMSYIMCSKCPVRYRFVAKLKEHMKAEHDIDLFICIVCKAIIEGENEFNKHLRTHSNIHMCAKCNVVFKKRDSIIAHLKWHEEMENLKQAEGAHVCEVCGQVLRDEEHLKEHNDKKHVKKYTCYYCGRMYKGEISFETHIKKHEMHTKRDAKQETDKIKVNKAAENREEVGQKNKKFSCGTCERNFVNERSLMWHQRLHTNERPYVCDVCGRAFVSLNRRNQHAVCAHTAPARRCPLCPALFHLRSMVNTHLKKVHLKAHKRRNRTSKHQNVFWRTETVPIQELSVSIQNEILELQAAQQDTINGTALVPEPSVVAERNVTNHGQHCQLSVGRADIGTYGVTVEGREEMRIKQMGGSVGNEINIFKILN